jgi:hypothetical protein
VILFKQVSFARDTRTSLEGIAENPSLGSDMTCIAVLVFFDYMNFSKMLISSYAYTKIIKMYV